MSDTALPQQPPAPAPPSQPFQNGYAQPNHQQDGYPQHPYPQQGQFQPAPLGYTVAGSPVSSAGKRFAAACLDSILFMVTLGIGWLIWSMIVWSKGTSPGKSLLGMRVVKTDTGKVATWGTMALREIVGKSIIGTVTFGLTSLISCFMILGSARQGIWDKIATTTVVDDPNGQLIR